MITEQAQLQEEDSLSRTESSMPPLKSVKHEEDKSQIETD